MENNSLILSHLSPSKKIAFMMSKRLGDSLLSMVVVNNLQRHNFNVVVFGSYIDALKKWFPEFDIRPLPAVDTAKEILNQFDVLLHAYPTDLVDHCAQWHSGVIIFDQLPIYRSRIPMPDIQVAICEKIFHLKNCVRTNGLMPLPNLVHRKNMQRVVMHPTSFHLSKNWLPQRFLQLAKDLQNKCYQPVLVVSPQELPDWEWIKSHNISVKAFEDLSQLAEFLYESGWFIGNDSGIGHLASNLGVPTITLAMRPGIARRWRPTWSTGVVILPPKWLVTKQLKERFWKYFISLRAVKNAFFKLAQ